MGKSLNDISPNFRDYLLRRNLAFAKTIEDNNLTSRVNGIGKPVSLDSKNIIEPSQDFDGLSDEYRKNNLSSNEFDYGTEYGDMIASENSNSAFTISNSNALKTNLNYNSYGFNGQVDKIDMETFIPQQNSPNQPYLDSGGNLYGLDNEFIKPMNIVGSFLSGNGVGVSSDNEILPNFDVRSTISGRVLSATGEMNETPLGYIQNQELVKNLKNKILYSTQRELLGRVDINPLSLLKGNPIIRPDYDITVGHNLITKVQDTLEDFGGFKYPISTMSRDSSYYTSGLKSGVLENEFAKNRIKNTGRGQVKAMFDNLKENKYVPGYEDKRTNDGPIDSGKETYDQLVDSFVGLSPNQTDTYSTISPTKGSILAKTKEMFDNGSNKTLIKDKGLMLVGPSEIEDGVDFNGTKIVSRGSGVKSFDGSSSVDPNKVFGRVFTVDDAYDKVKKLQKNRGLNKDSYADDSVLGSNGFVKVSPYKEDASTLKKFMFSLENLAWSGENITNLPASEIGNGDAANGIGPGRIMWFPPYDISITDNNTANWESTNFIGRGEPIYTYNNSERTGTLSFKMVIDYPSYLEDTKTLSDDILRSIMAGARDIQHADLKNLSIDELDYIQNEIVAITDEIIDTPETPPEDFKIFYNYGSDEFDSNYETSEGGMNDFFNGSFVMDISNKLKNECPSCKVYVRGNVSKDEFDEFESLGRNRSVKGVDYLKSVLEADVENEILVSRKPDDVYDDCEGDGVDTQSDCRKRGRYIQVSFEYNPVDSITNKYNEKPKEINTDLVLNNDITKRFINEANYFKKLKEDDPIIYDQLKDKLEFFHPAFHSLTPEGFNSRLNFLLQCTRQGPTIKDGVANNLVFGKAPICIMRIGDFYHTKIAIDNVNFSYEPLVWDLNPEGIGVQPMICRVDLSFKIIGGSSLKGPISQLQNAVSSNFFANSETYDPRAKKYPAPTLDTKPTTKEVDNVVESIKVKTDEVARAEKDIVEDEIWGVTQDDVIKNIEVDVFDIVEFKFNFKKNNYDDKYKLKEPLSAKVSVVVSGGIMSEAQVLAIPSITDEDIPNKEFFFNPPFELPLDEDVTLIVELSTGEKLYKKY